MLVSHLVSEILILLVTALATVGLPLLAHRRARKGRPVALPTFVRAPDAPAPGRHGRARRDQMARMILDGDTARVIGSRLHLVIPLRLWHSAPVRRRYQHDSEVIGSVSQTRLYDARQHQWLVGVPDGWGAALDARRTRPLRRWTRWRLAGPRWIGIVVGMLILIPLPFHALWWTGHSETATVVRVGEHKAEQKCLVTWQEDDGAHTAWDSDCMPAFDEPGQRERVRVLGWPFKDLIMDDLTLVMTSVLCWFPSSVLGLIGRFVGWIRLRRPAVELVSTGTGPRVASTPGDLTRESVHGLWSRCAELEGWYDEPPTDPPDPVRRIAHAALPGSWWLWGLPFVVFSITELDWRWPALAIGLTIWAYAAVRALLVVRAMAAASMSSTVSSWSYLLVRTPQNTWTALLVLDARPAWQVDLGHPAHPDAAGSAVVHGELRPGSRVALTIDGGLWHPMSAVQPVDDAALDELRLDLIRRIDPAQVEAASRTGPAY